VVGFQEKKKTRKTLTAMASDHQGSDCINLIKQKKISIYFHLAATQSKSYSHFQQERLRMTKRTVHSRLDSRETNEARHTGTDIRDACEHNEVVWNRAEAPEGYESDDDKDDGDETQRAADALQRRNDARLFRVQTHITTGGSEADALHRHGGWEGGNPAGEIAVSELWCGGPRPLSNAACGNGANDGLSLDAKRTTGAGCKPFAGDNPASQALCLTS
jgi:hypothetical protein